MKKATNIELDGIDSNDFPDFCDAFILSADHEDGSPFTDAELETLNDDVDFVHEQVFAQLN